MDHEEGGITVLPTTNPRHSVDEALNHATTMLEHEAATDASWTSAFQAACWINPLYYSTTMENRHLDMHSPIDCDHSVTSTSSTHRTCLSIAQQQQQHNIDKEVLGWTLDSAARGVACMGTAVFVSTELLRLAEEAAGCQVRVEGDVVMECNNRIYGMRPSSLLTNIVMVVGLFSAFIMPLVGSIIDHTDYRRQVGCISAAALSVFILVQMLIMERFWFMAAILQVFIAFSYTVHLCSVYAYLPELTSDPEIMVQYTAQFSAAQYGGSVGFLIVMIAILSLVNRNGMFGTSTISQSVVFVVCSIFFGHAWTNLFSPRPARHRIPLGQSLISAGFWKIYTTGRTILQHHSAIKFMLLSVSFTEAATTTFTTVAITYMTLYLQFTPRQNGIAILLLLLFGLPGTRLAAWSTSHFNPLRSLQACLVLWIVTTAAASLLLKEPNQEGLAYCFAMIWGIGIGWIYPSEKTLYVTIIPRGQEAELMGVYICACQILSWLPPLVFSIMTEMGLSMRIALFGLTIYFFIGFMVLFLVGDYDEAVRHGKQIDQEHHHLHVTKSVDADITYDQAACYQQWMEKDHIPTATGSNQVISSTGDVEKNDLPLPLMNR